MGDQEELRLCERAVLEGLTWFEHLRAVSILTGRDVARGKMPEESEAETLWGLLTQAPRMYEKVRRAVEPRVDALRAGSVGVALLARESEPSASEAVLGAILLVARGLVSDVLLAAVGEEGARETLPSFGEFSEIIASLPDASKVRAGVKVEWARLRAVNGNGAVDGDSLDELDRQIIEVVRREGPILGKQIAREINESSDKVRKRLGKLGDRNLRILTNRRGEGYRVR